MSSLLEVIVSALAWLVRGAVVKFLVMAALFFIVYEFTPVLLSYLSNWLGISALTSSFSSIPSSVWFFLDFMALDYGVPLLISAYVTRFLIRRIPIIG